jgi:hypothetical protein
MMLVQGDPYAVRQGPWLGRPRQRQVGSSSATGGKRPPIRRWLYARLVEHFGREQIFKDVDSLELGDEFPKVIADAVGACDVLLALVGKRWLTIADHDGKRRLENPDDFVRLEIEAALQRNVRVIPILVDGATMPRADELPSSLVRMVHRHALELSPTRFEFDTNRLLRVLDRTLTEKRSQVEAGRELPSAGRRPGGEPVPPGRRSRRWFPMAIATVTIVAGLAVAVAFSARGGDGTDGNLPTTTTMSASTRTTEPTNTTQGTETTLTLADLFRGFVLRRPNVELRARPKLSAQALGYLPYNTPVYIVCTATGDPVTGPGRAGSAPVTTRVWDMVRTERGGDDLGFVPDVWVKTGTTRPVARAC